MNIRFFLTLLILASQSCRQGGAIQLERKGDTIITPEQTKQQEGIVQEQKGLPTIDLPQIPKGVDLPGEEPEPQTKDVPATSDDAEKSDEPPAETNQGLRWIAQSNGAVAAGALSIGTFAGETAWLCRVKHEGNLLLGQILPTDGVCYVTSRGELYYAKNYETLVMSNPELGVYDVVNAEPSSHGALPAGSFTAGDEAGIITYYCRTLVGGKFRTGKLIPKAGGCFFPSGIQEFMAPTYEVLVLVNPTTKFTLDSPGY